MCAIANTCTHRGGLLNESERDGNVVTCPWHGSQFDVATGAVKAGPATRKIATLKVKESSGNIVVG